MIFIPAKIIDGTLVVLINGRIKMGWGEGMSGWLQLKHVGNNCSSPKETMPASQIAIEIC